jgi:large subunit ribosomal protein L1
MGKTKTAFVTDTEAEVISGEEKYKERLKKKAAEMKAKTQKESGKLPEGKEKVHLAGTKGGQRVKLISAEPIKETEEVVEEKEAEKAKKIRVRGKKYLEVKAKIDRSKFYKPSEAIKIVKEASISTFDGTFEIHMVVKKQGLTINITLPNSSGKEKRIEVASDKTIEDLKSGKVNFDVLLATPDMMPKLVAFARVLGPKGLMPNPKNGTLIKTSKDAANFSAATTTLKTEKDQPVIHATFGKVSLENKKLEENLEAILEAFDKKQIVKAFIKSTMSPSVKLTI